MYSCGGGGEGRQCCRLCSCSRTRARQILKAYAEGCTSASLQASSMGQDALLLSAHTLEAATIPVGRKFMTSLAKEGPDRKAQGCLRPSTSGMISDIILPVPTSRPLLTDRIGTWWGSSSCRGGVGTPQWPYVRQWTG